MQNQNSFARNGKMFKKWQNVVVVINAKGGRLNL